MPFTLSVRNVGLNVAPLTGDGDRRTNFEKQGPDQLWLQGSEAYHNDGHSNVFRWGKSSHVSA